MYRLYYQYPNTWFGDCMPFGKDGKFYLFHQRDTRRPGPFGEPFGWDLATTTDFVHYEDHGTAIPRGSDEDQDQFIYAGTVFEAEGQYHAMYTGYNRTFLAQGRNPQVLMKATSDDLYHWQKNDEKLVEPQPGYDPADWRDPFVMWDDERGEYIMILGARKAGRRVLRGCTVWFTSKDLKNWTFQGDFWAPDIYPMHEMPDLFKIGDWWYLLISEYGKIVYRMSRSLKGPWTAPIDDAFDGDFYYAGRTAFDGQRRVLFGWIRTRETWRDDARGTWGGTFAPHEIYQRPDGTLGCRLPETAIAAFAPARELLDAPKKLVTVDSSVELPLAEIPDRFCKFEAQIRFTAGTRAIGARIYEDVAVGDAYDFHFRLGENRVDFEKTPGSLDNAIENKGLTRPVWLKPDQVYTLQVIVDDDIATLYIDGVALNTRMYNCKGNAISLYMVDGTLEVLSASISTDIKR